MSNYGKKTWLKKRNRCWFKSLKSDCDRLDIEKLETTPVDLYKLSNIIEKEVVKKTVFDKLVKKINVIQTNYIGRSKTRIFGIIL